MLIYDVVFTTNDTDLAQTITVTFPAGYTIDSGSFGVVTDAICNSGCVSSGFISVNGVNKLVDNVAGSGQDVVITLNNPADLSLGTVAFTLKVGIQNPTADGLTGDFTITTDAAGEVADTNGGATITADSADYLGFSIQPDGSVSGSALTTQSEVTAYDQYGNIATDFIGEVTLSLASGDGSITAGDLTANAVLGTADFTGNGIVYTAGLADHEDFTLAADAAGLTQGTSAAVDTDVVATEVRFGTQPSNIISGVGMDQPSIEFTNAAGIVDTDVVDTVLVTEDGAGSLGGTVSEAAVGGVVDYSDLVYSSVADNETGITFTFTDEAGGTFNALDDVASGLLGADVVATKIVFNGMPGSIVSGVSMAQPVIEYRDEDNLLDLDIDGDEVEATVDVGSLSGGTTAAAIDGVATFAGLVYHATADHDLPAFSFDDASGVSVDGISTVGIDADVVATKIIIGSYPGDIISGVSMTQPEINYTDAENITDTDIDGDQISVVSDIGTLNGTATATAVDGVATFTDLVYDAVADHDAPNFTFSDDMAGIDFSADAIIAGPLDADVVATKLIFDTLPSSIVSGVSMTQPIVQYTDADNLTDVDIDGDDTLTISSDLGSLSGTVEISASNGFVTFTDILHHAGVDHDSVTFTFVDNAGGDVDLSAGPDQIDASGVDSDVVATAFSVQEVSPMTVGLSSAIALVAIDAEALTDTDYDSTGLIFTIQDSGLNDLSSHVSPNLDSPTIDDNATILTSFAAGVGQVNFTPVLAEALGTITVSDATLSGTSGSVDVRHQSLVGPGEANLVLNVEVSDYDVEVDQEIDMTITVYDSYGNLADDSQGATPYTGQVLISTNATDPSTVPSSYTFDAGDNGVKVFEDDVVFYVDEGGVTITATHNGVIFDATDTSDLITVSDLDGDLAVTSIEATRTVGLPTDVFADGFEWTMHATLPITDDLVRLKFDDFIDGDEEIPAAGNIRYCSEQSTGSEDDCSDDEAWNVISAADTYGGWIYFDENDLSLITAGRQVDIRVQVSVPEGTPGGSYSSSYGVESDID